MLSSLWLAGIHCNDATEAELCALEEGLKLSLLWTSLNITVETDCADALELIREGQPNASIHAFRINTIRQLIRERGTTITKISRDANKVSHELARMGKVQSRTAVWARSFPLELAAVVAKDCEPTMA